MSRSAGRAVELRAARIPWIGTVAHHHWLVVSEPSCTTRWEVWQRSSAGGESWGHLHRNLLPPRQGVGNGASWLVASFDGEAADRLAHRLLAATIDYPWRHLYRFWPGPNSNTFVQWVLGDQLELPWRGIGRRYATRRGRLAESGPQTQPTER